jgi:hypothetical protein
MNDLLKILESGGWGVAAVFGVVIWRLWLYTVHLQKELRDEGKTLTAALIETRDAMREQRGQMEKLIDSVVTRLADLPCVRNDRP